MKNKMFRKYLIGALSVWGIAAWLIFLHLSSTSFQAKQDYQALIQLGKQGQTIKAQRQSKETKQKRFQVSKQYLFQQEHQRLQWRLTSQNSELVFLPKRPHQGGLLENFENIHLIMQEKWIKNG